MFSKVQLVLNFCLALVPLAVAQTAVPLASAPTVKPFVTPNLSSAKEYAQLIRNRTNTPADVVALASQLLDLLGVIQNSSAPVNETVEAALLALQLYDKLDALGDSFLTPRNAAGAIVLILTISFADSRTGAFELINRAGSYFDDKRINSTTLADILRTLQSDSSNSTTISVFVEMINMIISTETPEMAKAYTDMITRLNSFAQNPADAQAVRDQYGVLYNIYAKNDNNAPSTRLGDLSFVARVLRIILPSQSTTTTQEPTTTTVATTTLAPTTTTVAPTTLAPTTTTVVPTTLAPTTVGSTTSRPTMAPVTTARTTTLSPEQMRNQCAYGLLPQLFCLVRGLLWNILG